MAPRWPRELTRSCRRPRIGVALPEILFPSDWAVPDAGWFDGDASMAWWESGLERMERASTAGAVGDDHPGVPLSPAELAAFAAVTVASRCWQPMWERPGRRWGGSAAGMPGYAGRCPPVCGLPKVTQQGAAQRWPRGSLDQSSFI